jgi:hypothetical protein
MNWDENVDFPVDMAEEEGFASDFAKWDEIGMGDLPNERSVRPCKQSFCLTHG